MIQRNIADMKLFFVVKLINNSGAECLSLTLIIVLSFVNAYPVVF